MVVFQCKFHLLCKGTFFINKEQYPHHLFIGDVDT